MLRRQLRAAADVAPSTPSRRLHQTVQAGASAQFGAADGNLAGVGKAAAVDAVPVGSVPVIPGAEDPPSVASFASAPASGVLAATLQVEDAVQTAAREAAELARQAVPGDALDDSPSALANDAAVLSTSAATSAGLQRAGDGADTGEGLGVVPRAGQRIADVVMPANGGSAEPAELVTESNAAAAEGAAAHGGSSAALADNTAAAAHGAADVAAEVDDGPDVVDVAALERAGDLFVLGTAAPADRAGAPFARIEPSAWVRHDINSDSVEDMEVNMPLLCARPPPEAMRRT